MAKYITMVYEGEKHDERFGWDYEAKSILFQSSRTLRTPSAAMEDFNQYHYPTTGLGLLI